MTKGLSTEMPELYPEELIDEVFRDLDINESALKPQFKECLEQAARHFIWFKPRNESRFTRKKELKLLAQLASDLQKCRERYLQIVENNPFRFFEGLREIVSSDNKAVKLINEGSYENGVILNKNFIAEILETIEVASEEAVHKATMQDSDEEIARDEVLYFSRKAKTTVVSAWLEPILDFWSEHSTITISEGRHGYVKEGVEPSYQSPAMRILHKLLLPLNERLESEYKITDSMLSQAVELYRKSTQ